MTSQYSGCLPLEKSCIRRMESMFLTLKFCHQPDAIHFYTRLESYEKLVFVRQTLGTAQDELIYYHGVRPTVSVEKQFFLTLVKLRQNKVIFELSCLFDITERSVTNVFVTWVNFMAVSWDEID